jgi:hypothetical protein
MPSSIQYAEAEYLQSRLLKSDVLLILDIQDRAEKLNRARTKDERHNLRFWIDLDVKRLSNQMRIGYDVANALASLELPEEVSK